MDVQEVYAIELGSEVDVFAARQGGREVAAAVGMDGQDLVRVATALSEVSRDVVASGGGRVVFSLPSPGVLRVVVTCHAVDRLRSMSRLARFSLSDGRPSRFRKPPGIFPAA